MVRSLFFPLFEMIFSPSQHSKFNQDRSFTCGSCNEETPGYGNSSRGCPQLKGKCVCDKCNTTVVIPARLAAMGLAVAEFKEKRSKEPEDSEDGAATAEITKKISDEDLDAIVEGLPASFGPKADLKVIFIIQISFHLIS